MSYKCSKLPATFAFFPVLSLRYAHAPLRSFYLVSTFDGAHVRKNTWFFTPAKLQCLRSGACEPGNKAIIRMPTVYDKSFDEGTS